MDKNNNWAGAEDKTLGRYTKKALTALSSTLKLHQKLVWMNPETNELSIKDLPTGSISVTHTKY